MPAPVGRPHRDLVKLAQDLIEWCLCDDSLNLNGFCAKMHIAPPLIIKWTKENEQFSESYALAKAMLANRREKALTTGALHVKAYDLNASNYDYFLKTDRMEEKRFEEALKAENAAVDPNVSEGLDKIMTQLSTLQSDRKMAANSNNTESKS